MNQILLQHVNMQKTGGYNVIQKTQKSKWCYVEFWGIYGNHTTKILKQKGDLKDWDYSIK